MSKGRAAAVTAALVAVVIQFAGPRPSNPPVDASRTLETSPVFDRACRDCHSNETRWPWYSHVAPVRWFVVGHVEEGREEMNVSDWAARPQKEADHWLAEVCEQVKGRNMPLPSYLILHSHAKLTEADIQDLCAWAERGRRAPAGQPSSEAIPGAATEPVLHGRAN